MLLNRFNFLKVFLFLILIFINILSIQAKKTDNKLLNKNFIEKKEEKVVNYNKDMLLKVWIKYFRLMGRNNVNNLRGIFKDKITFLQILQQKFIINDSYLKTIRDNFNKSPDSQNSLTNKNIDKNKFLLYFFNNSINFIKNEEVIIILIYFLE